MKIYGLRFKVERFRGFRLRRATAGQAGFRGSRVQRFKGSEVQGFRG